MGGARGGEGGVAAGQRAVLVELGCRRCCVGAGASVGESSRRTGGRERSHLVWEPRPRRPAATAEPCGGLVWPVGVWWRVGRHRRCRTRRCCRGVKHGRLWTAVDAADDHSGRGPRVKDHLVDETALLIRRHRLGQSVGHGGRGANGAEASRCWGEARIISNLCGRGGRQAHAARERPLCGTKAETASTAGLTGSAGHGGRSATGAATRRCRREEIGHPKTLGTRWTTRTVPAAHVVGNGRKTQRGSLGRSPSRRAFDAGFRFSVGV